MKDRDVNKIHRLCKTADQNYAEITNRAPISHELFMNIGEKSIVLTPFFVDDKNVSIGENCLINHHLTVLRFGDVSIGNNVGISSGVTLIAIDHPHNPLVGEWEDIDCNITIKDGAWIGANVTVLPNITIGENAIVGAGSVVTKNVLPGERVAGNPAKPIKD